MASRIFSNRLLVFLAMVVVSAISWMYVTAAETNVDAFPGKIPVTVKNLAPNLVALPETEEVEVRLRADRSGWSLLSADSFTAQLDLQGLTAGVHEVPVTVVVSVPNVQIVEKNPATITVSLEESVSKDVPVRVVVQGKAAAGKAAGEATATPDRVLAVGAKSIVAAITDAQAIVTLKGEEGNVQRTVQLSALGRSGEPLDGVRFEPNSVGVAIPIVQASNARTVGVRVVTIGNVKDGFFVQKISVSPATVTITGSDALTSLDTAPIDLAELGSTKTFTVNIVYPTGVQSVDGVSRATVTLTITPLPTSKQVPVTYTFVDLDASLKIDKVDPASGTVVVAGPTDVLSGLNAVTATVSLSGKAAGLHTINIAGANIQALQNMIVSGTPTPSSITVTLSAK